MGENGDTIYINPEALLERLHSLEIRVKDTEDMLARLRMRADAHGGEIARHQSELEEMQSEMTALRNRLDSLEEEAGTP